MAPSADRDRRELAVLLKRGPAIFVYKGLQGQVAEGNYQRAYEIAKPLGDVEALFKAIWGLWFCANLSRRTAAARDRAEELVALAQRSGDESLILEAIHCRWSTSFFRGDAPRSLSDGREGIRHYDPDRHGRLAAEFGGHDPGRLRAYRDWAGAGADGPDARSGSRHRTRTFAGPVAQSSKQPGVRIHERDDDVPDHRRSSGRPALHVAGDRNRGPVQFAAAAIDQRLHERMGAGSRRRTGRRTWRHGGGVRANRRHGPAAAILCLPARQRPARVRRCGARAGAAGPDRGPRQRAGCRLLSAGGLSGAR